MKIQKKEIVFKGFYQLKKVMLKSDSTGKTFEREQFSVPNSIGVLVFNPSKNKIILVKQFRVGPEKELIEIVAGKVEDKDEALETTAKREVMEEIGYQVTHIQEIHRFYTCPGPVTESMTLYYAEVDEQLEQGGGVASENEEIEILAYAPEQFIAATFNDAKTIMAQQWFKIHKTA